MKTAVSIPDDVYEAAQRLARRTGTSRSALVSEALREYLARHAPDAVTEAMNAAVDELGANDQPFVRRAARRTFERTGW